MHLFVGGWESLGLATCWQMPGWKLERREDFVALEEQSIAADRFAVPLGYEKVRYSADCQLMRR